MTTTEPMAGDHYVIVGQLGKTYGVQGWVKVNSYTEPFDNILQYTPLYSKKNGQWEPISLTDMQQQGTSLIAHVTGYDTPEAAKVLTGLELAVHRSQLPTLSDGEYFWCDLVGMQVITCQGVHLGAVESLLRTGGHDILVVQGHSKQHLIPLVQGYYVMNIDSAAQQITVDWDAEY